MKKLKKRGQKRKIRGNPRRNKENRPPPLFHSAQREKRKIFTGVQTIVEKIQEMGGRNKWARPVSNGMSNRKIEKFSTFSSNSAENREKGILKAPKNSTGYERSVEFFA